MSPKRTANESPARSPRSKWARTSSLPLQRHEVTEQDEVEDSDPAEMEAISSPRELVDSNKEESSFTSETPMPSQALTPFQAPKRRMTQTSTLEVASPLSEHTEIPGTFHLNTTTDVSTFWYGHCQKVFRLADGYKIDLYKENEAARSQRIVVWEEECYDEALFQRRGSPDPEEQLPLPDKPMRTEADCDFSSNVIQPPETMRDYERLAKLETRHVPIFVIECYGADADNEFEWRNPTPQDISRAYEPPPQSQFQQTLIEHIYTFNTKIGYEPKRGLVTQEQCFCATAIGNKVKFWKHVSPYPHLKPWSEVLDMAEYENTSRRIVSEKLAQIEDEGYDFAMEIYRRETFA